METHGASRVARLRFRSRIVVFCLLDEPPLATEEEEKAPVLTKTRWSASWERHAHTHVLSVRRPSLTWTLLAYAS